MIEGIDVSSHQPDIDWSRIARWADFVVIKATGGRGYTNQEYRHQLAGAREAGLVVGHYHFAHETSLFPGGSSAAAEAAHFLRTADVRQGEFVALDIEDTGMPATDLSGWALDWLGDVERRLDCAPFLYSFPNYLETRKLTDPALARYPLWHAYYRTPYTRALPFPRTPAPWAKTTMWQWNGGIPLEGIPGDTDCNLFDGTREELIALGRPGGVATRPRAFGPFGKELKLGFRDFYESRQDALALFGYPITDEFEENGRTVQYFERARFEWHEGVGVLLGRVGAELRELQAHPDSPGARVT